MKRERTGRFQSARRPRVLLILLIGAIVIACGGDDNETSPTATTARGVTVTPTATQAEPTVTPTQPRQSVVPAGQMLLTDQAGDVSDVDGRPLDDFHAFVDLVELELVINDHALMLSIETAGEIPESLAEGEEMWWALEIDDGSSSLHRVTVMLRGSDWVVMHYDFIDPHGEIFPDLRVSGTWLEIEIPLEELWRLGRQFRWWTAAIWGGLEELGPASYGDRAPEGDPIAFPEGTGHRGPTYESLPAAPAPYGLGGIDIPEDSEIIADLFTHLPAEIAGFERTSPLDDIPTPGEHHAYYGVTEGDDGGFSSAIHLAAIDAQGATSDFSPDTTGREVIEYFASGYDWDVEAAGRDGDLGWVQWQVIERDSAGEIDRMVYGLVWAEEAGRWYFSAGADSPEYLDALVEALVEAAKNTGSP